MPTIKLDHITKIEGHAKLTVKIDKGKVKKAQLEVFEGARFFEGILKGRKYNEAPILTSRICGVCPQAHSLTSLKAIEDALDVTVSDQTANLRRLMLFGQIIQSHVLHLYFLAIPDYLGCKSALDVAKKFPDEIKTALRLKKLANKIVDVIGGREIHSVTGIIGGFSKLPTQDELDDLLNKLKREKKDFIHLAKLLAGVKYPDFERETQYITLESGSSYAFTEGKLTCIGNKCIPTESYIDHLKEYTEEYSTAKFVVIEGREYMVGALARLNVKAKFLCSEARAIIKESGIKFPSCNPFHNNFAQAIEMVHIVCRAIEYLESMTLKDEVPVEHTVKAGHGIGVNEVPRGLLFHEYEIDSSGLITRANIIPPTTQNLRNIEEDIKAMLPAILKHPKKQIIQQLEMLIRAYDPCISCSTHFLQVRGL